MLVDPSSHRVLHMEKITLITKCGIQYPSDLRPIKIKHYDYLLSKQNKKPKYVAALFPEKPDEDFINIYKVNVIGPYQMIRAVEPYMKKNKFGSVVNVSSIAGITGIGSSIAYAASKGALNTMTLSLAKALGPEIRVNTVCPGFIGTGWFLDRFGEEKFNKIVKDQEEITPLKRAGTPNDIAKSVVFFCLEGGEHITGETLISDAGMHLSLPR